MHTPTWLLRQLSWLLLLGSATTAQTPRLPLQPVHWSLASAAPLQVQREAAFDLRVRAAIDLGWHLYALQEPNASFMVTEISLQQGDPAELLRTLEEKPRHTVDPDSHLVTAWFAQSAVFTLRLKSRAEPGMHDLHVLVRYQACNDRLCLPPRDITLPVPVRLAP